MADALRRFEFEMHSRIWVESRIPPEWHEIATRRDSAKVRVTLRLDADVVKWFRSMGPGYQPRMNDVLSAFMHAKLAGLLHGDDTIEPFRESWQSRMKAPEWGETERERGR
ncbi:hypothetical protein HCU73_02595 [Roseibacterium sp. KMU-115]|uniref:BrnA antitoxin family protein n=2 Tax=Roseicyclus persicicus TaxID=2650661 RepID=A0A7X6JXV7_9RHOB|nr:hypothetical protein [Roseibacterium persicicum]